MYSPYSLCSDEVVNCKDDLTSSNKLTTADVFCDEKEGRNSTLKMYNIAYSGTCLLQTLWDRISLLVIKWFSCLVKCIELDLKLFVLSSEVSLIRGIP